MEQQLRHYIQLGYSQRDIAKVYGVDRNVIVNLLNKYKLKTENSLCVSNELKYSKQFNKQYQWRFEYVGGYINNIKSITIKCLECGNVFNRNASALRANVNIMCPCCLEKAKAKKHIEEEINRLKLYIERNKTLKISYKTMTIKMVCPYCGNEFIKKNKRTKHCSSKCGQRVNDYKKREVRLERMKKNGNVEEIYLPRLFNRDKGKCYICGEQCDYDDCTQEGNTFIAGNSYPSIDHVIPIAYGGTHTWNNVKLAHRICNSHKSDTTDIEINKERLRFTL